MSQVALLPQELARLSGEPAVRARGALRLFIRAVLQDEFAVGAQSGTEFDGLVERAAAYLESDREFSELLGQAMDELLAGNR